MKRLIALAVFFAFTAGLNATITKEEIYKMNPKQFKQLKTELSKLNQDEVQKLKTAFVNRQISDAFKAVFVDKKLLNKANYAVVKNGKIIKTSKAKDADGLYFWHEFSQSLENPPAENTCAIYNATWEDGYANTTCGMLKYRMDQTSPYAGMTEQLNVPQLYLFPDMETTEIDNILDQGIIDMDGYNLLDNLAINTTADSSTHPDREIQFESLGTVVDTLPFIGFLSASGYLYKPLLPFHRFGNQDNFSEYYRPTEFSYANSPLYTLKSGNYLSLFVITYNVDEDDWWAGQYIVFKWLNLRVENYYIGDVGLQNNTLNSAAKITWDNNYVSVDLEDEINPQKTTYEVYDISGKLLQKQVLTSNHTKLALPAVSSGVYIIRLTGKKLNLSKKISFVK